MRFWNALIFVLVISFSANGAVSYNDFFRKTNSRKDKNKRESSVNRSLPFGQKIVAPYSLQYYNKLIYYDFGKLINDQGFTPKTQKNIKLYKLPYIKKVSYMKLPDFRSEFPICENGKDFSEYINLKYFRYRLPDIKGFKVYFMCNYDPSHLNYSAEVKKLCFECLYDSFGYLILYNHKTQSAYVITIYYQTFGGDTMDYSRVFYIDNQYHISIADITYDDNKSFMDRRMTLIISSAGQILVKKIK